MQAKSPKIETAEYRERLVEIHKALGHLNYKSLYEYEFGEKLNETQSISLMNFWNFRNNDYEFLVRFELIAEKINSK